MPETDNVPALKAYQRKMLTGQIVKKEDGSYALTQAPDEYVPQNSNWYFLTGDKAELYKMARQGYMIDNGKPDSVQIENQFLHSQFFALVDKYRRLRGVYDGLKQDEVNKLIADIGDLLKEKVEPKRFLNGFSNSPN
jgi:protein SCO1/2